MTGIASYFLRNSKSFSHEVSILPEDTTCEMKQKKRFLRLKAAKLGHDEELGGFVGVGQHTCRCAAGESAKGYAQ